MTRAKANWSRKIFSFPVFLGAVLVVGGFFRARDNPTDPDTWWHVAVGDRILAEWSWPEADPYSFTAAGNPWIAYEWLGEVLMALAARWGGMQGRAALLVVWAVLLLLLLYYYSYLRSRNWKAAFVACTVLLPIATIFFTLRPQLFGYSFLLLTLICLERFRQGSEKALWFLPLIFLVWVNTHGTFAFGLLAIGVYWVSGLASFRWGGLFAEQWTPRQRLYLEAALLVSLATLLLTPYGSRLAAYPMEMALLQPANIANILEWQPLGTDWLIGKLFVGLVLVYFLAQVAVRQEYRVHEMGLLLFAIFSAALHIRFLTLFLIFFAPLLATLVVRWMPPYQPAKDRPMMNAALIAVGCALMVAFFPSEQELNEHARKQYPQDAVNYLRSNPVEGPMWNEYAWGGYLIWAAVPDHRVFIDGRADLYEYGGVLPDYVRMISLERNTISLFRRYNVRSALVDRKSALRTLLDTAPGWSQAYSDELSALYVYSYGAAPAPTQTDLQLSAPVGPTTSKSRADVGQEALRAALETVPKR